MGVPIAGSAQARLIGRLVTAGSSEDAWAYYAAIHPGADRRMSRDPRFTALTENPTPFDWIPVNDIGTTTSIGRGDRGGVFDFMAVTSLGGPLLRQMQMLPPGDYRLEGHGSGIDQPMESRPYWVLTCSDGRELGRLTMPNSARANGTFNGLFSVPRGCPVQILTLIARSSDAVGGVSGQIDRAMLRPAGKR